MPPHRRSGDRQIFVEILIRADLDLIWQLTQDPQQHPRWDARFSAITPTGTTEDGAWRFCYELDLPLHRLVGTGISLGERRRPDGTCTSALRFDTPDRLSPMGAGRGYWRYLPTEDGVRFRTGYDYHANWGLLDRLVVRRFVGWLTAWSFDRLRIWAETGVEPETWRWWSVLQVWRSDRPRAQRCLRRPGRDSTPPETLATLEAP